MTSQGEDTDEDYLDDPIKLIDFEQARVRTEPHQKYENKFQHDGYDPADSDGDVLIEKEPLPSLGRFAVTLPHSCDILNWSPCYSLQ
ncbi:uncharacterized protein LOC113240344 isoform X2 [Hyposmocoma kahamanoa]|uniref:uncharacterized protein LOC113240344 isoform X2 n=1 Tax=Hyposmocoma kahamanoa TaxID=1477025 RepID=UPI000E6D6EE4|nr:uncharacterized protein LOC113240344 isoform X2 [Hyposmocoma kahamanoa]